MKYFIQTFGCQMNVYDTESLSGLLNSAGHSPTSNLDEAELILLNTCAIREGAEQRVRGRAGQLKKYKNKGSLKFLGICGCMGQKEGERLIKAIPHLDLVMGPGAIGSVAQLVDDLEHGKGPVLNLSGIQDEVDQVYPTEAEAVRYPRFLSIMKGCDKKCSFCIVPYTRGAERSRDPRIILQEAEILVNKGFREITLIGQTVNSYHHGDIDFAKLLEMVNNINGLERIRFATSHPNSATPEMLKAVAELDHVCEQLHLPVQSGSNRILDRMERNYTREEYLDRIQYFREQFKDHLIPPAVTTDVIVGFPGETDEDFQQTLDLMQSVRFDAAFMFKYSPRRGTPAAEMEDQVHDFTKAQRLDKLIKLQHQIAKEQNQAFFDKTVEVMVERIGWDPKKETNVTETRMRTSRVVKFYGDYGPMEIGDIFPVTITDASSYTLYGTPLERKVKSIVA